MKKKLLLLLSIFVLSLAGCAEDSGNSNGETVDPNQTPSATVNTDDEVDNAFLNEFKKYVKESDVKDSPVYSGEYSQNAETNIKSLFQNIVGRGQMPAAAGIGEVTNAEIASAMAKIIASNDATASILPYTELDVEASVFMGKVMGVFMSGTAGSELLDTLRRVRNNTNSIIYISDKLEEKISIAGAFNGNGTSNMVYLFSSFIDYLRNSSSGISGIITPYVLPDNMPFLDALAQAFYDRGEYIKDINNWNIATPDFEVMIILTNGMGMPAGVNDMMAFMATLSNIFVEYGYATASSSEDVNGGGNNEPSEEQPITTSGMFEQVFPAMLLKSFDDAPVLENAMSSYPVMPTNRAIEFLRAMVEKGAVTPAFNPVLYNQSLAPIVAGALKTAGYNYDSFNKSSAEFQVISFLDTAEGQAMITAFNEAQNTSSNTNQ